MSYILTKTLLLALKPVVWILLLLAYSLLARSIRAIRWRLAVALIVLWFFSTPTFFSSVATQWEPTESYDSTQTYQYGIVLGRFGYYNDSTGRVTFGRASDRLWQTLLLYHTGRIRTIVVAGGRDSLLLKERYSEAAIARRYLLHCGVPDSCIITENESMDTHQNALYTKRLLNKYGAAKNTLLITSAFHLRRASACFRKQGLEHHTYGTDTYLPAHGAAAHRAWFPQEEILEHWALLIREWVAYVAYSFQGKI